MKLQVALHSVLSLGLYLMLAPDAYAKYFPDLRISGAHQARREAARRGS